MSSEAPRTHPPKPHLAFRVGVIGHRPDRLHAADLEQLRARVGEILDTVRQAVYGFHGRNRALYSGDGVALRIVSPLAEGTDRLVARAAMEQGFQLSCPMPFPQGEYEKDFLAPVTLAPDSLDEFRELLARGEALGDLVRFELDGRREDVGQAYGASGQIVLNHSDVLIVVWDGKPAQGPGGSVDKIREAIRFRVPVVCVEAVAPHDWHIVATEAELPEPSRSDPPLPAGMRANDVERLREIVIELLAPPRLEESRSSSDHKPDLRAAYFLERKPRFNLAFPWKLFRDIVSQGRPRIQPVAVVDFEQSLAEDWPLDAPNTAGWANRTLRPHYAWADKLADFYGDCYRSAFIYAFLFGVIAVLLALVPLLAGEPDSRLFSNAAARSLPALCTLGEILVILSILVAIGVARHRNWHGRWMEYRIVAELIRNLRILLPVGGGRPFPRIPPHLRRMGSPERTWMYWYVRAVEREVGLPTARVDAPSLAASLLHLRAKVLHEQQEFHRMNHARSERIEHSLHRTCFVLFVATLVLCVVHFLPYGHTLWLPAIELPRWLPEALLPILCALLPAMGAAIAGINNQGEFARIAKRSHSMVERLTEIDRRIDDLLGRGSRLQSREVIVLATELAQLMVDEVSDWRVVFQDRPPVLPG